MTRATALSNTSFPSWDKSFPFQVWIRCHNFLLISDKIHFFEQLIIGGRPKYFSYCFMSLQPHMAEISVLSTSFTFLLNTMVVFSVFMHFLETCAYSLRTFKRELDASMVALQKMRLSSAKKQMIHSRDPSTNTNIHKTLIKQRPVEQIDQILRSQEEEVRGQRVPLP